MIRIRKANERGHANHGWLDSHFTFSFADYWDPDHMGFRALRVINDDRIAPGAGFPTHPHRDMEILTYVTEGAIEHKDSMGTGSVLRAGELQRMSAGTGVTHSEFNHSKTDPLHLLQIWILPAEKGQAPSYEQKAFPVEERRDTLRVVASPCGRAGSLTIHQDVEVFAGVLSPGATVKHSLGEGRHAWLHIVRGAATAGGHALSSGDAIGVSCERELEITAGEEEAELLLFDLA